MITDYTNGDLYLTKEEHEAIIKQSGALLYCKPSLVNEIEITSDAICSFWQGKQVICHHRNKKYCSTEQLIKDNAFYNLDSSELIILPIKDVI